MLGCFSSLTSAVKWLWLLENVPAVAQAVEEQDCCFGTVSCWAAGLPALRQAALTRLAGVMLNRGSGNNSRAITFGAAPDAPRPLHRATACLWPQQVDSWLMWCLTGGAQGGVHVTDDESLGA